MIRWIVFVLFCVSPKLHAGDLVAVLDLKFIEDTGQTAGVFCFGEDDDDCQQWATFYLYEAKVKKVLSGELPERKFSVIYGRHALLQKNLNGAVALLTKLTDHERAEYQIKELGQLREMYCFSGQYNQPSNVSDVEAGQALKCFEEAQPR